MFRNDMMLKKGFKMYYGELTTPVGIKAWMEKIRPNFFKKINLVEFEYKAKKVFDGVDWGKLGFKKGDECCYFILKEFNGKNLNGDEKKPKL
jgi:hypothetical protein